MREEEPYEEAPGRKTPLRYRALRFVIFYPEWAAVVVVVILAVIVLIVRPL